MNPQVEQVQFMEKQCDLLFNSNNNTLKNEAQQKINFFFQGVSILDFSIPCLEYSRNIYLHFFTLTQLNRHLDDKSIDFSQENKNVFLPGLLNYIGNSDENTINCIQYAIQIYVRIVMFGDSSVGNATNLINEAKKFIEGESPIPYRNYVGFTMLYYLVEETSKSSNFSLVEVLRGWDFLSNIRSRDKFTERQFLEIINISIQYLANLTQMHSSEIMKFANPIKSVLEVIRSCLLYEFGSPGLETYSNDMVIVNLPKIWHSYIYSFSTPNTLFKLIQYVPPDLLCHIYECLGPMISMGRNTITTTDRSHFANAVADAINFILERSETLCFNSGFHAFAKMLLRFHISFSRSELESMQCYQSYIKLLSNFTLSAIRQHKQIGDNSLTYVLQLWSRLFLSGKHDSSNHINRHLIEIVHAYISLRIDTNDVVSFDDTKNYLIECHDNISAQLDTIGFLFRINYSVNYHLIKNEFDLTVKMFQIEMANLRLNPKTDAKLAWLIFLISHIINCANSLNSNTGEIENCDANLCTDVLTLMTSTANNFHAFYSFNLERGFICFLGFFQKAYIGQSNETINIIYTMISSHDTKMRPDTVLLIIVMNRIMTYLKVLSDIEIVESAVNLLSNLTTIDYVNTQLMDISSAKYLLFNHIPERLTFLGMNDPKILPIRTKFFSSLAVMASTPNLTNAGFKNFIKIIDSRLSLCKQKVDSGDFNSCRNEVMFLARDLRGICYSMTHSYSFSIFLTWIRNGYLFMLAQCLQYYYNDVPVASSIFRFMIEATTNRFQRLHFDVTSPNGIYLMKAVCAACSCFGSNAVKVFLPPESSEYYAHKIKLTVCALTLLNYALNAKYTNVALFEVYNDNCLKDALKTNFDLFISIDVASINTYEKLRKAVFSFIIILTADYYDFLDSQPIDSIISLITVMRSGLNSIDFSMASSACTSLECLFSEVHRRMNENELNFQGTMHLLITQHIDYIYQTVLFISKIVIVERQTNVWTFARPFLALVVINNQILPQLEKDVCQLYPPDLHSFISQEFQQLSEVLKNLNVDTNKERFIEAFSKFLENLHPLQTLN